MSRRYKNLVIDKIPYKVLREYFDVLATGKTLSIVLIFNEDQKQSVFVEGGDAKKRATCRVFFRKPDLDDYKHMISTNEGVPEDCIRTWETDFKNLSDFFVKYDAKAKKDGMLGVEAITTVSHRGRIREVDIFWTDNKEDMV